MDTFLNSIKDMIETDFSLINIFTELKDENRIVDISQKGAFKQTKYITF